MDPKDNSHAYLCVQDGTTRIGIPLYGNSFVEGMAQGVQWLIEGDGQWRSEFLNGRPVDGKTAYYDALIRYFAHHAPSVNPCIPTILVSHAALQTTQPAAFFWQLHHKRLAETVAKVPMPEFAKEVRGFTPVKDGIADAIKRLNEFESCNSHKAGYQFYDMAVELTQMMKQALAEYISDENSFIGLVAPDAQGLDGLVKKFGFPPLYTKDIDSGWAIGLSDLLKKLFAVTAAMYSLVIEACNKDLTDECPLLRKRYCTFPKDSARYCHRDRLNFADVNGEVCAMGQAAQLLSLYRKPLLRLK
jgi:hypothetical protein